MKERIIGRQEELTRLNECMNEDIAQLIVVYGRRRVGKTFLINEFFNNSFAFKLTGAYNKSKDVQLRNFTTELNRRTGIKHKVPADWTEAFNLLRDYLDKPESSEKQVVFLDELPWLDTDSSGFLSSFEWFWNDWASTRSDIVCIVCGSATSWMSDHLDDNKGGLFNRHTCRLYLKPWSLYEVELYLQSRNIHWSRYEIAECYMIMGGIPYYLRRLKSRLSFSQNIDNLFFKDKGELWDEFGHLYATLFSNSDKYIRVVEALSGKPGGLTRNEIIDATGFSSNGDLTAILNNLAESGFVRANGFYKHKSKDAIYQLADYYSAFYFRYIRNNYGKDEHYWSNAIDNPSRRSWAGLTFEQLCKDHVPQIKHKLGISGVLSEESSWFTKGDDALGISGAQIDLLIERRDRVINLCEMKFSVNEYVVDKTYDANLRNKLETFRRMTNNRKSLQITMITTYGVKPNMYSNIIQSQVTLDDLFHE